MDLQIDSRIFEVQDENSLQQLMSFLSLDIQHNGQKYAFKDDKQFTQFQKFRTTFDSLKDIYPNFQMKIKPKLCSNNQNQNQSFNKEKDSSQQKNSSTQINSDQSLTIPKGEQFIQQSFETPTDQGMKVIQQQVQSEDHQLQQANNENQHLDSSIISEMENTHNSIHEFNFESEIMSQILDQSINIFDDQIKIKQNDQTFIIQLKNNYILSIIEQLYLEKWNLLIKQLNLIKQSMNNYKLQQNTDYFYINQEIQNFIDSIQIVEIELCIYTCYTMKEQQSMMNRFLQQHKIQIAQIGEDFFLVSRQQSQQFLKEMLSQIYENYRGYMFYFTNAKPYQHSISGNPILEKSRYLFYKKYLTLDVQQYSFNQYFNENCFFIEMNFFKIQENKELVEKYIKEYVGGFFKNLFMIKFSIESTQEIGQKVEKAFQNSIEILKLKILFYKNNEDLILFGINEDILKLLSHLQKQEITCQFFKLDVEVDKQNFLFKLKGAQQKIIDVKSIINLFKEFGFHQVENKKLGFSTSLSKNLNFTNLLNILRFFCNSREQNNNRMALQTFHQKFRTAIDQKDLKKDITFLGQINFNNNVQQQQQNQIVNLNIRSELQQFPISQTINLNPIFLDEIIQENLYQEFLDKFVQNNQKIQFQKISQGKYQLQCSTNQVVTQFKQYFDKFEYVRLKLDKTSLSCFELSHYLKKELKKRCIYWKIMEQELLYLITRNTESLKYCQEFKYQGRIIYMLSLNATNYNEKIEYYQLVLARTNYFKYKIQDFLKQNLTQIKEIEFREEQEISSFCIIHSNFSQQEQRLDQCMEQIQSLIGSKIFIELKTKPEIGKKILEKIIEISDLYVSQKQQYSDYYITMLGSKQNYQKIEKLFQKISLQGEQVTNLYISFYIEQFIPFKNIIQKSEQRDKFKRYLENKGFNVDDTNIKWIIEPKQQLSITMIFSSLIEQMNQVNLQTLRNNHLLNLEMMEQTQILKNDQQNDIQEIENSLLAFLEKENKQNINDGTRRVMIQQIENIDNQGYQDSQTILLELDLLDRTSRSEVSDQDNHQKIQSIPNQEYDILAEFTNLVKQTQLPANSLLAKFLKDNYPNQNFLVQQPYVDQKYKEYFENLTKDFVDLYVIQKQDKVYYGKFSKNILYFLNPKSNVEKLMSQSHLILIVFKANRQCKYTSQGDKERICLMEDNQVLPYLFLKKK